MPEKLIDFKIISSSILASLLITLFIGCFYNSPSDKDKFYEGNNWYYLNRGYPKPWSGVASLEYQAVFPQVKMPFLKMYDDNGAQLFKIVDLEVVFPYFAFICLIMYLPYYIFSRAVAENKSLSIFLHGTNIILVLLLFFIYFFWFPRI